MFPAFGLAVLSLLIKTKKRLSNEMKYLFGKKNVQIVLEAWGNMEFQQTPAVSTQNQKITNITKIETF